MNRATAPTEMASTHAAMGYDAAFLTVVVPMPQAASDRELVQLDYAHFTVLLDRNRRLAAVRE